MKIFFLNFSYIFRLSGDDFSFIVDKSNEWIHTVINLIASDNGQEIRIYHDGNLIRSKTLTGLLDLPVDRNGKIVIGRAFTDLNQYYASVYVDEMLLYNEGSTEDEITKLSQGNMTLI